MQVNKFFQHDGKDVIPINALFQESEQSKFGVNPEFDARQLLKDADMILGVNVMNGHEFIAYGRDVLKEIVKSREARDVKVVHIGIDQETDELEQLLALVQVVKGHHDYVSYDEAKGK